MAAIYDEQVKRQLYEYEQSLRNYPISAERRREKLKQLKMFLQGLSHFPNKYPTCNKKKLGQTILPNGRFLNTDLRQTTYWDKSNTEWSVSFFPIGNNKVKIYRLIQTRFVDESIRKILSLMERIENLYKHPPVK